MDHEQAFSKTIVSRVVSPVILNSDSTFWGREHLLSPKNNAMGGFPNPPPEGALKERRKYMKMNGVQPPNLEEAYYMPRIKNPKLQRFYIEVMVKMTIFVAL